MIDALGRVLFFRSGLRGHVKDEIDREQQKERRTLSKLEAQVRELQQARESTEQRLAQLDRRYAKLLEDHEEQHALLSAVRDELQAFQRLRVDERVAAVEQISLEDQQERLPAATASVEAAFPLETVRAHVKAVIAQAALMDDPYPHVVLNDVLPEGLHALLYTARPPQRCWRGGREHRENWTIDTDLAPLSTEAPWGYMDNTVVPEVFVPELVARFGTYLDTVDERRAQAAGTGQAPSYARSGGRLMLRRPGYHFEPHLDPHRAMLTGLFYFGSSQDSHDHGTKLFRSNMRVPEDREGVFYPSRENATCELVKTVPSRPNSMLVFASRIGLHGADIPADAKPSTLERYAYQFYVGKPQKRR